MKNCERRQDRDFGLFFSALFMLLSAYSTYRSAGIAQIAGFLILGLIIGFIAVVAPVFLNPFSKAWMKLGEIMGKISSPLVLGVIYFVLITPISLLFQIFGRDALRLKKENVNSYWIDRVPPDISKDSFKNQF